MLGMSEIELSQRLGWKDDTLSRYYDGKTQSKRYSDMLRDLRESPVEYLNILENSKFLKITL